MTLAAAVVELAAEAEHQEARRRKSATRPRGTAATLWSNPGSRGGSRLGWLPRHESSEIHCHSDRQKRGERTFVHRVLLTVCVRVGDACVGRRDLPRAEFLGHFRVRRVELIAPHLHSTVAGSQRGEVSSAAEKTQA